MSRASNLAGFTTSISPPTNLNVGIITATSFSGSGSGLTGVGIGSTGSINTSGIITASSFVGALTGTLTNATGLPISGLTSSTSTALGVGSIELGHATDTTLSRSAAGVLAVEGVVIPSISSTDTLTNKTLTSPTLTTPALGTPTSVTLTNATGLPLSSAVTGTLPIANGGTNSTATPTAGGAGYGTGTAHAYTAAGTSGQLLQSNGASAPTWVTASAGALTFLSTVTASSSSTVDIETTFNGTYDAYLIVASNIRLSNQTSLYMRLKIAGSYISTGTYFYHCVRSSSNGATYGGTDQSVGGNTQILIADSIGNDAEESASIQFLITGPTSTTQSKQVSWSGSGWYNSLATISQATGVGGNTGTGALTGVRLLPLSGQISAGTFRLYGIANS